MEFHHPVEGLSFVQCFRRWVLNDLNEFRLVGISFQNDGSNIFKNYESFLYSTLDIARNFKNICVLGNKVKELAKGQDNYMITVFKKMPKTIKYSDIFPQNIIDPRFNSQVLIRTNNFSKIQINLLFSNQNYENHDVIEFEGQEFYILHKYANAVRKFSFEKDLNNESIFYLNMETNQFMDHRLIFNQFITYIKTLSDDMSQLEQYDISNKTKLNNLGLSNITLEYLLKMGIFTVEDLYNNFKDLDMSLVSSDSLEIMHYLMEKDLK